MASFDDLGRALRDDAAAHAPRASAIDLDAVTAAARARRRPRQWAVGTLSVVAALGLGGLAVAAVAPPVMIAATESAESSDMMLAEDGVAGLADEAESARPDVVCGGELSAPENPIDGLQLEVSLPASAPANGDVVEGTLTLTNTGTSGVSIATLPLANGVLMRDESLVGSETAIGDDRLLVDLSPGESLELPVWFETTACDSGAPLIAGDYLALIRLDVVDASETVVRVSLGVELRLE